jgi:hypothetical protein
VRAGGAEEARAAMLEEVLQRGELASLRGELASLRGELASLRGELRGELRRAAETTKIARKRTEGSPMVAINHVQPRR